MRTKREISFQISTLAGFEPQTSQSNGRERYHFDYGAPLSYNVPTASLKLHLGLHGSISL